MSHINGHIFIWLSYPTHRQKQLLMVPQERGKCFACTTLYLVLNLVCIFWDFQPHHFLAICLSRNYSIQKFLYSFLQIKIVLNSCSIIFQKIKVYVIILFCISIIPFYLVLYLWVQLRNKNKCQGESSPQSSEFLRNKMREDHEDIKEMNYKVSTTFTK